MHGQFIDHTADDSTDPVKIKVSARLNLPLFEKAGFATRQPIIDMNNMIDDLRERVEGYGANVPIQELQAAQAECERLRQIANSWLPALHRLRLELERESHKYTTPNVTYYLIGNQDDFTPIIQSRPQTMDLASSSNRKMQENSLDDADGSPRNMSGGAHHTPSKNPPRSQLARYKAELARAKEEIEMLKSEKLGLRMQRDGLQSRLDAGGNGQLVLKLQAEISNHQRHIREIDEANILASSLPFV